MNRKLICTKEYYKIKLDINLFFTGKEKRDTARKGGTNMVCQNVSDKEVTYGVAEKGQLKEMVGLFIESFNAQPWYDHWTEETATKRLQQLLDTPGFYGICAYQNQVLCGFILGYAESYYDGMDFIIKEFAVCNQMRGQGIGSLLFQQFEKELKNKNIKKIALQTIRGDYTEHFYQKQGFYENQAMLCMEKELPC